jgi:hypothetical protein
MAVPNIMLNSMAWLGDQIPALPVGSDTLKMLAAGSHGNGDRFIQLLGYTPRSYRDFLRE